MSAVIVGRKYRVFGVFALEHPRRVRDANVEHAVWCKIFRGLYHCAARMLLEDVPDHLDGPDVALTLAELHSLIEPADCRPERRTPHLDEALGLQLAKRFPDRSVAHVLHLDVVELENVDMISLESLETL